MVTAGGEESLRIMRAYPRQGEGLGNSLCSDRLVCRIHIIIHRRIPVAIRPDQRPVHLALPSGRAMGQDAGMSSPPSCLSLRFRGTILTTISGQHGISAACWTVLSLGSGLDIQLVGSYLVLKSIQDHPAASRYQ